MKIFLLRTRCTFLKQPNTSYEVENNFILATTNNYSLQKEDVTV
uniref:Uncharacterized protein n=1 Tax=Bartonella rochalimae ATCC BAA-1498 TaxID=685782 RepID=E6YNL8_9HYPH|nr:hypothetical protein BARRO_130100 [Bartonella rochalimae ATCC BAA-1498]